MKRTSSILIIVCLAALTSNGQYAYQQHDSKGKKKILSAIGIAGGITYGKQVFSPQEGPLATEKYLLGFNAAVLAEFFHHPVYRWRIELGYNQLGTTEQLYVPSNKKVINRTNYLSLNNYLKINFKEAGFVPYFLIGPRVEYLLNEHAGVYPDVLKQFDKFHVTGSIGLGTELTWKNAIRPFVEVFYNHDLMVSHHSDGGLIVSDPYPTDFIYRGYELRIGLKFFFDGLRKDVCPKVDNPAGN
jgi:hypothetical protein